MMHVVARACQSTKCTTFLTSSVQTNRLFIIINIYCEVCFSQTSGKKNSGVFQIYSSDSINFITPCPSLARTDSFMRRDKFFMYYFISENGNDYLFDHNHFLILMFFFSCLMSEEHFLKDGLGCE